jgi:hypothetical protein
MYINRIQPNQVLSEDFRFPERNGSRVDVGKESAPELSARAPSISVDLIRGTRSPEMQAQSLLNQINYMKEQLGKILVDFPPFFPLGTYQRTDLIKGIRTIQDEVEKSSLQNDMTKEISSQKLTENATDDDISAALDQLFTLGDEFSKGLPPKAKSPQPGTLVNIKI